TENRGARREEQAVWAPPPNRAPGPEPARCPLASTRLVWNVIRSILPSSRASERGPPPCPPTYSSRAPVLWPSQAPGIAPWQRLLRAWPPQAPSTERSRPAAREPDPPRARKLLCSYQPRFNAGSNSGTPCEGQPRPCRTARGHRSRSVGQVLDVRRR